MCIRDRYKSEDKLTLSVKDGVVVAPKTEGATNYTVDRLMYGTADNLSSFSGGGHDKDGDDDYAFLTAIYVKDGAVVPLTATPIESAKPDPKPDPAPAPNPAPTPGTSEPTQTVTDTSKKDQTTTDAEMCIRDRSWGAPCPPAWTDRQTECRDRTSPLRRAESRRSFLSGSAACCG